MAFLRLKSSAPRLFTSVTVLLSIMRFRGNLSVIFALVRALNRQHSNMSNVAQHRRRAALRFLELAEKITDYNRRAKASILVQQQQRKTGCARGRDLGCSLTGPSTSPMRWKK
jgi:hypothetical protein